jgi:hypothetical protein
LPKQPKQLLHDNAKEFIEGEFNSICTERNHPSPHTPLRSQQNPTEKYMDILTSMTRSLLFISGLNPAQYWEHALEHATTLQNRTSLIGRCTAYELRYGKRPQVSNLRGLRV